MFYRGVTFIWIFVFFIGFANALDGISPAAYRLNFQPGLKQDFEFNFYSDDVNSEFEVYLDGDLAQYAKFSPETFVGGSRVVVSLKLPREIETPGLHRIAVGARRTGSKEGGSVGIVAEVRGAIVVDVPYPGKYAEIGFSAKDANIGEDVEFKLKITSKGVENILASSSVEIYDVNNKKVETLNLGVNEVKSTESVEIVKLFNTGKLEPGRYKAVVNVEYGGEKPAIAESNFRVGEFFVDIVEYTKIFEREKINPVFVNVESHWNELIQGVYIEGRILNTNITFKTPSENLGRFETKTLSGYFDTSSIEDSKFKMVLRVFYQNMSNEKIVDARFKREINYVVMGLIAGFVLVVLLFVWLYIKFRRLEKNVSKKK